MQVNFLVSEVKPKKCIFLRVIEFLDINVRMYAKLTVTGVHFKFYLLTRGKTALSDEKTCTCNRILRVIGCTDYVRLNNFYMDFLMEKIGTFQLLRANEVYVPVRVVLTRGDLY